MKTVSLVLIGDIHYPDYKSDTSVDLKDNRMSPRILSTISQTKLKKVSDEISRQLMDNGSIQAVLLCGDLTSKGNIDGYKDCLNYLQSVLSLSDKEFWQDKHLHVVPGNHDISRHIVDIEDDDVYKKFDQIKQAWRDINREEMQPNSVRTSDIQDANSKTTIFSVNSCVGCGEQRYLPNGIRVELQKLLKEYSDKVGDAAFDLLGEQLDTPAIDDEHLNFIGSYIRKLQKLSDVPVLLAHHGLLPQATTRIQIYSELLNSGNVRFALASLERPVIYCHGHLHQDPIEIVTHPQQDAGKIITISAPLFIEGFNLINLIFNDEGLSLGCEVIPFRLKNGSIVENNAIRIPLLASQSIIPPKSTLRDALDATTDTIQRFREIMKTLTSDETNVSNTFLELEWMGLVEIYNRKEKPLHWQIRRTTP